jgi:predicted CXXCH cytochrome family protein
MRKAHLGFALGKADCVSCHDPHGSPEKGMIRARPHKVFRSCDKCHRTGGTSPGELAAKGTQLCFRCHGDKRVALQKPGAHEGAKGDCLDCHTPHASNERGLTGGRERETCLGCHDTIDRLLSASRTVHPTRVEGGKCSICHEPHQTENGRLLVRPIGELCKQCHGGHAQFGHPVGPNVIDPRTKQPVTCLSCHGPHGTQWGFILLDNPSQALCVRCHDPSGAMGGRRTKPGGAAPAKGGGR